MKFISKFSNYFSTISVNSSSVVEQIIAGVAAGVTVVTLIKIWNLLLRPRLRLLFRAEDTYTRAPNQQGKPFLFMHLMVKNIRKTMAKDCQVFLLKLEKKKRKKFENIYMKQHFTLKWSNENSPKGFQGLEIPGNYRRRIDLICASYKGVSKFFFYIEEGIRGISNGYSKGEYRLTIQTAGSNTNTVTKRFILKWKGKFTEKNIKIKEEAILTK